MEKKQNSVPQNVMEEQAMRDNAIAKVNKKLIIGCVVAFVAILAGAGIWYWVHTANVEKANEAIGKADMELNDSVRNAMYKQIADDGSNAPNQRARIMTAINFYDQEKYQEALDYLDKVSVGSDVVTVGVSCLKGDCYVNLNKLDEALDCYSDALDQADGNPQLVPYVLLKEANIYRSQKKYDKEYKCYSAMRTDYPAFLPDVEKYYERAKIAAGK